MASPRPTPTASGPPPTAWHTRSGAETARALQTDPARGLTGSLASERLAEHGPNALPHKRRRSAWSILVHQFKSLVVGLLVLAGGVAMFLGESVEAAAILAVIVINALIGFITEWKANRALDALRRQSVTIARVMRDGEEHPIPAEHLVPGDVVLVNAGDRVPADGRIVEHVRLEIDESPLTGESVPVQKSTEPVDDPDAPVADRHGMAHLGTAVTDGRAKIIVTATGPHTELGKIGRLIAGLDEQETPLEQKLAQLSRALLLIVLVLCAVIVVLGWLRGNPFLPMVEVGISLAIAAVPEGLLAVTTMTLAIGMQRMARLKTLVRRLPAVEALGSTTVICSDKTGTLTRNEMTVRAFGVSGRRIEVSGAGYAPDGQFRVDGHPISAGADEALALALRIGALCNDAKLDRSGDATAVLGDPTEAALIVAAEKAGFDVATLNEEFPRVAEIPFDSARQIMATVHQTSDGGRVAYVKGGPAVMLDASARFLGPQGPVAMTPDERERLLVRNRELAANALRVLALGYRELAPDHDEHDATRGLTFVGLVGMMDPLRDEAASTVQVCREAGIRVVMITGDQEATAQEIARQLGIDVASDGSALRTVHARKLSGLDDEEWLDAVRGAAVFARVSPQDKLRIVDALQRQGHVVAMTGDGVNDAPALRQADIGIAMGIRGTEVAKEAAAMVITDDNFATIVSAVEQGRIIVHNILRFIHYLFTCNFAEILTVFTAIMIGWPLPLGVLQILWLNLVTDIFPAMALALEPLAPDVMKQPPRDPKRPLLSRDFGWLIVWQGALLASVTLGAFALAMRWYGDEGEGLQRAITIAFMTLALGQTFHALNARSRRRSAFGAGFFGNRWLWGAIALCVGLQIAAVTLAPLRALLEVVSLSAQDWALVGAASLLPIVVVEIVKLVGRLRDN